jgi:hypothetical protein
MCDVPSIAVFYSESLELLLLLLLLSPVTGFFFLVLLLNHHSHFKFSHSGTFRIMCDVPSIAVFYSESIELLLLLLLFRLEDNIKMDLQEVGGGRGDWMELAQNKDGCRALVSTVKNFRVP